MGYEKLEKWDRCPDNCFSSRKKKSLDVILLDQYWIPYFLLFGPFAQLKVKRTFQNVVLEVVSHRLWKRSAHGNLLRNTSASIPESSQCMQPPWSSGFPSWVLARGRRAAGSCNDTSDLKGSSGGEHQNSSEILCL